MKNGVLLPDRKKALTFGEFAADFWEPNSQYVRYKKSRRDIFDRYILMSKKLTIKQIIPFFGKMPLDKISGKDVDKWLLDFKDSRKKEGKPGK